MNRDDYKAAGKKLFDNFADDILENCIVLGVGIVIGYVLKLIF